VAPPSQLVAGPAACASGDNPRRHSPAWLPSTVADDSTAGGGGGEAESGGGEGGGMVSGTGARCGGGGGTGGCASAVSGEGVGGTSDGGFGVRSGMSIVTSAGALGTAWTTGRLALNSAAVCLLGSFALVPSLPAGSRSASSTVAATSPSSASSAAARAGFEQRGMPRRRFEGDPGRAGELGSGRVSGSSMGGAEAPECSRSIPLGPVSPDPAAASNQRAPLRHVVAGILRGRRGRDHAAHPLMSGAGRHCEVLERTSL